MANNMSNFLETALFNHVLRNTPYSAPATTYLALYTSDPGEADSGTEVSGGAYARQPITFGVPTDGAGTNSADIVFPEATASYGSVTHVGIRSAATGGNLLFYGPLAVSKTIGVGDQFKITAGQLAAALS